MSISKCGMCRGPTIPTKEGIYYCWECGQGHENELLEDGTILIHPYPRPQ